MIIIILIRSNHLKTQETIYLEENMDTIIIKKVLINIISNNQIKIMDIERNQSIIIKRTIHLQCTNLHRFIANNQTNWIWQFISKIIKNNISKTPLKSNSQMRLEVQIEQEVVRIEKKTNLA
jgi:hypothetical protein